MGSDKRLHAVPDADTRDEEAARGKPLSSKPAVDGPQVARHVTRRNGALEGEAETEESTPEKESQRDLTSLSGPVRPGKRDARPD